ncbi:MAG: phospholipase D-like domain-containing protein [Polyangiales bacterium]
MRARERWWSRDPVNTSLVEGHRVDLLHDGEQCFPAMLDAIAQAEREVLVDMYWFASDAVGRRFAAALRDRAEAGVLVRVIYDSIGSLGVDESMFDAMREAGCEVCEFNPVAPWRRRLRPEALTRRDHRKMVIVDRRIGFTGGINFGLEWASEAEGGGGWRDDMIRVEGPAVADLRNVFCDTWNGLSDDERLDERHTDSDSDEQERVGSSGTGAVRVLTNHRRRMRRAIRLAYLVQIRRARAYVYITNSYFVPDRVVRAALVAARRRGVDVRVLVPGKSDVPAVFWATRHVYAQLLRAGIRIFEWNESVLHSKTAVVDGEWCTVGTYNLDYLSWRSNLEVNVAVSDAAVALAMRLRFESDIARSHEVRLEAFRFRPLVERFLESFFFMFRKLL